MSKYTKGSWRVYSYKDDVGNYDIVEGNCLIAKVHDKANAKLIAYAPELLETLQEILPVMKVEAMKKKGFVYLPWIEKAQQVITKTEVY